MPHPPLAPWHVDAPHETVGIGDLPLGSGAVIEDCALSFVTHGALSPARDNAILVLPAIGQTHHRLDFLIGRGRALDPERHFVICVDALGNGLSTSPSTSRRQPGACFPRFDVRDIVASQRRLVQDHLGLARLAAVIGPSMGGMQALQWAVSAPEAARAVVALVPMARTEPWAALVNEAARRALMADPAWDGRRFVARPVRGWRAWTAIMRGLSASTPAAMAGRHRDGGALRAWLDEAVAEVAAWGFDPLDWIYQSWAYDAHDVGGTPGFGGDTGAALGSIRARTLVAAPPLDLYNPADAARALAARIPGARFVEIPSAQGHAAASAASPADVTFLNETIRAFLASA